MPYVLARVSARTGAHANIKRAACLMPVKGVPPSKVKASKGARLRYPAQWSANAANMPDQHNIFQGDFLYTAWCRCMMRVSINDYC